MTYDEIYNLRQGGTWLRNRAVAAVGKYAAYIAGLGDEATADQQAFVARVLPGTNAETEADYILWALCFNADVQSMQEAIPDATLQGTVEWFLQSLGRVKAV